MIKFINTNSIQQVKKKAPWAKKIVRLMTGGFLVFDSEKEYKKHKEIL